MKNCIPIAAILVIINLCAVQGQSDNLILITLDGLRWEELFGGAVDSLLDDDAYVAYSYVAQLKEKYASDSKEEGRTKLMPWMWTEVAEKGVLIGNRLHGNNVNVTNRFWFSYPGYNEILVGYSDPNISSNDKKYNENTTILEWLNGKETYSGKVAAFTSWDVFPYIINDKRSGIPVNGGFDKSMEETLTPMESFMNLFQDIIPSPWANVRLDAFTHHYALEYMKKHHPKVVYISYGETDDFAHDGRYEQYVMAANRTDAFMREIWEFVHSDPFYAGKTNLLITTDHGRGNSPKEEWKSHGLTYDGSNAIWIAGIGPDIKALGEVQEAEQYWQNQVAATAAELLGLDYNQFAPEAGKPLSNILKLQ